MSSISANRHCQPMHSQTNDWRAYFVDVADIFVDWIASENIGWAQIKHRFLNPPYIKTSPVVQRKACSWYVVKCLLEDSGSSLNQTTPLHVALMLKYYAGDNEVPIMSKGSSTHFLAFFYCFLMLLLVLVPFAWQHESLSCLVHVLNS